MSKLHVSLDVENLEESIAFYSTLFGQAPTKVRAGYAKFDVADPAVNVTMQEAKPCCVSGLSHLGIVVENIETVLAAKQRLKSAGYLTKDEMDSTCCYALQDKVWVKDPTGYEWEVYIFKGDTADAAPAASTCCVPAAVQGANGDKPKAEASSACCVG